MTGSDLLARLSGRPRNSPGWRMLEATKTAAVISRDGKQHDVITAGKTRLSTDHWLARERPEWFKPADRRDSRTYHEHRRMLDLAKRDLERELRTASVLPARRKEQPWRLP
jgi:hypothetical protein